MKNIVLCFDGTWNDPTMTDRDKSVTTNVHKLYTAATSDHSQHTWYDEGVGAGGIVDKLWGGAIGAGVRKNVGEGYRELLEHYEEGDKVFLFGFSRGACTARSLAGLVNACGLVQKDMWEKEGKTWQVDRIVNEVLDVYKRSRRWNLRSHQIARDFKKTFSIEGRIYMIGVWDTVNALNLILDSWNRAARKMGFMCFHDIRLRDNMIHAYQAIGIDEKRWSFYPRLWDDEDKKRAKGKVEQVWFAGVHANVGGGYFDSGLSDITLDWMLTHAVNNGLKCGLRQLQLNPDPSGELRHSHKESFWKYSPLQWQRRIPNGAMVHESVLKRINDSSIASDQQTKYVKKASHDVVTTPSMNTGKNILK